MAPYQPSNWNCPLTIETEQLSGSASHQSGTVTVYPQDANNSAVFYDNQTFYFNFAVNNTGITGCGTFDMTVSFTGPSKTKAGPWYFTCSGLPGNSPSTYTDLATDHLIG